MAQDIVRHFLGRGFVGKAMVVSIDKATALKMHDKVRKHWAAETRAGAEGAGAAYDLPRRTHGTRPELIGSVWTCSTTTDMAVIVSPGQNEIEQMKKLGLDIEPHRKRMNESQPPLDEKFKDPDDPLRLVFRLRHVADRLRRAELLDGVSRQADAEPHADADHRAREPRVPRQAQRRDRGLRQRVRLAGKGAGHLRRGQGRQEPGQDKQKLVEELRKAVDAATAFCAASGDPRAIEQLAAGSMERLQRSTMRSTR